MLGNLLAIGTPFTPPSRRAWPAAPELWLIGGIVTVLLMPLMLQ